MRSLFWRIFLTFWAAMTLIVVGVMIFTLWKVSDTDRVLTRAAPDVLVHEAATTLRSGGRPALTAWVRRQADRDEPGAVLVFDGSRRELLGRRLPMPGPALPALQSEAGLAHQNELLRLRTDVLIEAHERAPEFAIGPPHLRSQVARIADADGNLYWLLFAQDPRGFFSLRVLSLVFRRVPMELLAIAIAVSAGMSFALARYLSSPIEKLRAATRAVSHGDLTVRVAPSLGFRNDDLGSLAADFDIMAEHLRSLLENRQQLMRDLSHELRSPLARLQVALGLARRQGADLEQELGRIEREAQRLDAVIGQILKLARLQDSTATLTTEPFELRQLLEELVHDANLEARARHVKVVLDSGSPGVSLATADRALMSSAMENVLRNAVRYTLTGSTVRVTLVTQSQHAQVLIQDEGPGVPENALAHIFEPFVRVRRENEIDADGHGLGLAITERIVRLHGGSVRARNRDSGGLEVELQLPLTAARP